NGERQRQQTKPACWATRTKSPFNVRVFLIPQGDVTRMVGSDTDNDREFQFHQTFDAENEQRSTFVE
ncbi:MAG: hypothetical protein AAF346_23675, partial [Pseudomonadota bacterium]